SCALIFFLHVRQPRGSPLFPYTTLFRSAIACVLMSAMMSPLALAQDAGGDQAGGRQAERQAGEQQAVTLNTVTVTARRREEPLQDRKSTRLNSSHVKISYAVFCLKKKKP